MPTRAAVHSLLLDEEHRCGHGVGRRAAPRVVRASRNATWMAASGMRMRTCRSGSASTAGD